MKSQVSREIQDILRDCDSAYDGLMSLVLRLKGVGYNQKEIFRLFENSRLQLRSADRETDEDILMEVMDVIVGYCNPSNRIFETVMKGNDY